MCVDLESGRVCQNLIREEGLDKVKRGKKG